MEKLDNKFLDALYLMYRWSNQVIIIKPMTTIKIFSFYMRDLIKYKCMKGSEKIRIINTYPALNDNTSTTKFDAHYFYQSAWASRKIHDSKTKNHVDVGSQINLIADISAFTNVTFIDIRELKIDINNITSKKGTILDLPYKDNTVKSLSCLHTIEHIGLGRYGDELDPLGSLKACKELTRVLAKNGNLYVSMPIGKSRLCFNAHRVHTPEQILNYFEDLELVSLSVVTDKKEYFEEGDIELMKYYDYGCGLFHFKKTNESGWMRRINYE